MLGEYLSGIIGVFFGMCKVIHELSGYYNVVQTDPCHGINVIMNAK